MDLGSGILALGAGLAIAGGCIGTGIAQKSIGAAGMGVIAERPERAGNVLLFLVIPETLVIFGFIVALLLWLKLGA